MYRRIGIQSFYWTSTSIEYLWKCKNGSSRSCRVICSNRTIRPNKSNLLLRQSSGGYTEIDITLYERITVAKEDVHQSNEVNNKFHSILIGKSGIK